MSATVIVWGTTLAGTGLYLAVRDGAGASSHQRTFHSILFALGIALLGFAVSKPIGSYFGLLGLTATAIVAIVTLWLSTVARSFRDAVLYGGCGAIAAGGMICVASEWVSGIIVILVGGLAVGKARRAADESQQQLAVPEPLWACVSWGCWVLVLATIVSRTPAMLPRALERAANLSVFVDHIAAMDVSVWLLLAAAAAWTVFSNVRESEPS